MKIMRWLSVPLILILISFVFSSMNDQGVDSGAKVYTAKLKTLTDQEYPDNNSIGFRSSLSGQFYHTQVSFTENINGNFDIIIYPGNNLSDTIYVNNVNLLEFVPSIPEYIKDDAYLTNVCLINQELNRVQVRFPKEHFTISGAGKEKNIISRVDIANNCLKKGLWECILFTKEAENEVLYFQSWFDFPEELYDHLFYKRNGFSISAYHNLLKNYLFGPGQRIDLSKMRTVVSEQKLSFESKNDELYPLIGERKAKAKNIIYPANFLSINDFLTDQTKYATFAPPGIYTRTDPRSTKLSRLQRLDKAVYMETVSKNGAKTKGFELNLYFSSNDNNTQTKFVIGGLQKDRIPVLNMSSHHKGFQMPMGISNHSFYNDYSDLLKYSSKEEPYFAALLDQNDHWVNSHEVGIDGPLFFIDDQDPSKLHLLILSFERHSFVGHYLFSIAKT